MRGPTGCRRPGHQNEMLSLYYINISGLHVESRPVFMYMSLFAHQEEEGMEASTDSYMTCFPTPFPVVLMASEPGEPKSISSIVATI